LKSLLINILPHVKDTIEPVRLATTIAHHIPIIPALKTKVDIKARTIVSTIVLRSVAIRATILNHSL